MKEKTSWCRGTNVWNMKLNVLPVHLHGFPVDIWDIIRLYTLQPVLALMVAKAPFITFLNSQTATQCKQSVVTPSPHCFFA